MKALTKVHDYVRAQMIAFPFRIYRRSPRTRRNFDGGKSAPFWTTGYGGITVRLVDGRLSVSKFPDESINGLTVTKAVQIGVTLIQAAVWVEKQERKKGKGIQSE